MLRKLALASVILIAMTASVEAMDTSDLAGRAGFLIAAARYCDVSAMRTGYVRQWIAANLVAAAETHQGVNRFFATLEHHISRSSETRRPPKKSAYARQRRVPPMS